MKEVAIIVRYARRKRHFTSYIGEITPAVKDRVQQTFTQKNPILYNLLI